MHARPAVPRLPDEVRDEQDGRDRHRQREAPRAQYVTAPDKERRDEQDEDDGERVLRLEPDARRRLRAAAHEPRPSASRSASQRTTIVVSWSNATGWKSKLVASIPGENPTSTAASVCARRVPPSSRATSAPTTTVPALARIVNARSPTSDQPNSSRAKAASSAVTGGNST